MPNGGQFSHMDAHRIYDFTVVHMFKCLLNLGPRAVNMLQAPRHLNLALWIVTAATKLFSALPRLARDKIVARLNLQL